MTDSARIAHAAKHTTLALILAVGASTFGADANVLEERASSLSDALPVALPLAFERNVGQSEPNVRFVARGGGFSAFLMDDRVHIAAGGSENTRPARLDIRLAGQTSASSPRASSLLPGVTNYFRGDDPQQHIVDVPTFGRVEYPSVYPGIDLVYYGERGALEYDFVVAARADPRRIALEFAGADHMAITRDGELELQTPAGRINFRRPVAYQTIDGRRRAVDARYIRLAQDRFGFKLGRYDAAQPLVIDPVLAISTSLWGTAAGVALDGAGNIYVAGSTSASDLPVAGGYQTQLSGNQDAYVVKLNPGATAAIFTTYLGARRATTATNALAVDSAGGVYVTGTTSSTSFPLTPGAYQSTGTQFVVRLKPGGNALAYSTRVPGGVAAIAVDAAGSAYLTGTTAALTPTPGVFQPAKTFTTSPFVAKLNPTGTAMTYATYLGGGAKDEARAIAIDATGNAYVAGIARSIDFPTRSPFRATLGGASDAFVAKIDPTATSLVYSTFLGGTGDERGFGVAVDALGQATVVGWTNSSNFPVTTGVFQRRIGYADPSISNAFITKLNRTGDGLIYSSYLGGRWCLTQGVSSCFGIFGADEGIDVATSVAVDAAGFAYVGGYATSIEFPLVDSLQAVGPGSDVQRVPFVAKIRPGGTALAYSAVLGTRSAIAILNQIAVDGDGGVVAAGNAGDEPFPLSGGTLLGSGDAFLFKLASGRFPLTLRSSQNPAPRGQAIVLTADVSTPRPGLVTFTSDGVLLGTAAATDGAASLSVVLAPGIHRLTATLDADGKVSPDYFQSVSGQ